MTATARTNPFAGIGPYAPTRWAPGHDLPAYPYPIDEPWYKTMWFPVMYYPISAADTEPGEGRIWLVEPFPAGRADGADGLAPIGEDGGAGVAVLRGDASPRPRAEDPEGDWIIPGKTLVEDSAYDVYVGTNPDLMAAWCEAYAIAAALNNGAADRLGVRPQDVEVLLAAERGDLLGDSRMAGTAGELRWRTVTTDARVDEQWVPAGQAHDLRMRPGLVEPSVARDRPSGLASGMSWVQTTYRLTAAARLALAGIRQQYDGPRRCRVCGCTNENGCPPAAGTPVGAWCLWAEPDLCTACR